MTGKPGIGAPPRIGAALANLVDGDHVRMVECRRRPRLLDETHQPARVAHDFGGRIFSATGRPRMVSRAR